MLQRLRVSSLQQVERAADEGQAANQKEPGKDALETECAKREWDSDIKCWGGNGNGYLRVGRLDVLAGRVSRERAENP